MGMRATCSVVNLVSAVGKNVTRARHILASEYGTRSCQPAPELDDENLLLELPLLRLFTDGAAAVLKLVATLSGQL